MVNKDFHFTALALQATPWCT